MTNEKDERMQLASIEEALKRIRRGEMVLVVDDEDRENEGDLQMAASWVTAGALNFMLQWARGLICMPAAPEVIDGLGLAPMVPPDVAGCDTPFTIPIDHVDAGSGISAADRALTIRRVVDRDAVPTEFRRPGHVFPLRAAPGGTLERRGHTESAVDLALLAGLPPVAVTCEVLDDDGDAASSEFLVAFAERHRIAMVSIDQIAAHRGAESRTPATLLL
ncbi:MAG: 3,4-dihydroxy-2-butanone-4-phosphate synthase [Acidimicrobiia bacterium]|nr:3,4-dihydroxy-2-butanone-4-phosphate synthase [Acidimicrobiia bacterium]